MSKQNRKLTRREFLQVTAGAAGAAALAACAPQATPTPAPTQPPAAPAATKAPEATKPPAPTAAPTVAPTKPAATAAPKIGAQLIGKLEGPEIIRDTTKFPKTFKEAPMLADLVKAGKLPGPCERSGRFVRWRAGDLIAALSAKPEQVA